MRETPDRPWAAWAYTMLLRNLLTVPEVIERLELEHLYRRTGSPSAAPRF